MNREKMLEREKETRETQIKWREELRKEKSGAAETQPQARCVVHGRDSSFS